MPPRVASDGSISLSPDVQPAAARVQRRAQEARHGQAGDGGGVLEGQEQAQAGALVRAQLEDVDALPDDLAAGDLVGRVAHQRVGQRGLARAVAAHDRVDLALADGRGRCRAGSPVVRLAIGTTWRSRMTSSRSSAAAGAAWRCGVGVVSCGGDGLLDGSLGERLDGQEAVGGGAGWPSWVGQLLEGHGVERADDGLADARPQLARRCRSRYARRSRRGAGHRWRRSWARWGPPAPR